MESSYILILVKEIKEITINHLEHVGLIELTNCNPWHMTQELANLFNKSSYWLRHSGFHWLFSMATNIWFVSRIVCIIFFFTLREEIGYDSWLTGAGWLCTRMILTQEQPLYQLFIQLDCCWKRKFFFVILYFAYIYAF